MLLNTDYIQPAELTGYVRGALGDLPVNQFTLARWLPNNTIDDLEYRFTRGGEGLVQAATFRSYEAEAGIGARPGVTRVSGELPPISRKIRLGEYDRLRQRRASQGIRTAILADSVRMTRAVAARIELARGEALYSGKIVLAENGVTATVDFGRNAAHTVTAGTAWTNTAASTPVTDLLTWRDVYVATNGEEPGAIVTSRRIVALLMQNAQIKGLAYPGNTNATLMTQTTINSVLEAFGLPPVYINDEQVRVGSTATRVIPDDRVLLLPAPGTADDPDTTQLGATLWGTTAESLESEYGIEEGEEPGIVAGAYSTKDPVAVWTKAAAIALPVLANPDLSFCADVA
ncbi:major capsid protein [Streptomyces sp. NPDC001054]